MEEIIEPADSQPKKQNRAFKSEFIVALAAIIVSVMTMVVYIYQANIMREQQHVSVWPYVEWDMEVGSGEFNVTIINKGVGPAIIRTTSLKFDEQSVSSLDYLKKVVGNLDSVASIYYTSVDKRVLSAGEQMILVRAAGDLEGKIPSDVFQRTSYELCFCNVYGECWTSTGFKVVASKCE
jgi:hypothetical protein